MAFGRLGSIGAGFGRLGASPGGGVAAPPGGGALLVGEADGFATDFTYATDASRVSLKVAGTITNSTLDSFYANVSTSPKQVFDVSGALVWSPHNMIIRSQEFDNAAWTKVSTAVTANAVTAPDGTLTADKYTHSSTSVTSHVMLATTITTVVGQAYTFQVWAKAAEWNWIAIEENNLGTHKTYFNIGAGAMGTINGAHSGATITASSGGYLCTITWTATGTTSDMVIYLQSANGQGTVAGIIGEGVYLWGAQANRGTTPTAYLATTSAARAGLAIDYHPSTHAALGVLSELLATNLLLNNATLSTQSVTVSAVAYTLSFWGTGTITLTGTSTAGPLVGTGASNRVSLTFTPTAGSLTCTVSGTVSRAQLEAGSIATSPIPTFAASATRLADGYRVTPASINYSATAGSWWADIGINSASTTARVIGYSTGHTPVFQSGATSFSLYDVTVTLNKTGVPATLGNNKVAAAFQSADRAVTAAGLAPATDVTAGTGLLSPGAFIGFAYDPSGAAGITGYIRKVRYVPRRKTNGEMQAETA